MYREVPFYGSKCFEMKCTEMISRVCHWMKLQKRIHQTNSRNGIKINKKKRQKKMKSDENQRRKIDCGKANKVEEEEENGEKTRTHTKWIKPQTNEWANRNVGFSEKKLRVSPWKLLTSKFNAQKLMGFPVMNGDRSFDSIRNWIDVQLQHNQCWSVFGSADSSGGRGIDHIFVLHPCWTGHFVRAMAGQTTMRLLASATFLQSNFHVIENVIFDSDMLIYFIFVCLSVRQSFAIELPASRRDWWATFYFIHICK